MGLWAYTVRELARHPGRSLFTLTGIAVGVAAAISALTTAQAARGQYRELFEGLAGRSALEVYAPGEAGFDPAIAESLAHVPGVRAALPGVQATGGLPSWRSSAAVVVRACRPGDGPAPPDGEVLVPEQLLEAHGMKTGGRLRLWGTAGLGDYTVSALPATETRKASSEGVVTVSLATAQHLFGLGDKINLVRLVLEDGTDPQAVREAVTTMLPPGLSVREPAGRADITHGLRASSAYGLTGLTAVALASAGYIVFGLAQLNLLARRSELAVLRTLGASTRQVEGILFRHALILGACGGALGTLCGTVLSWTFLRGARAAAGLVLAHPRLGWESLALGFSLAIGISLCAVWLPARRVCQTPPLVLFRAENRRVPGESRLWATPVAIFCLAVGLWILADCATGRLAPATGRVLFPPALVLTLVGLAGIVAPRLPPLLATLEQPLKFVFGVEGGLAVRQVAQRSGRSATACGVGFVTVTLVVGVGHSVLNTLGDVCAWTDTAIPADLLVRGAPPDPGFVLNVALPESLDAELAALDGVASVDRITFIPTTANGAPTLVLARTFAPEQPLPLAIRADEADAIRQGLTRGEAVLAERLAGTLRVGVGDFISLDTPHGPRQIRVAEVVVEFAAGGAALYLDWAAAAALFGPTGTHIFLVTAQAERKTQAEAAVARFCSERGLFLQRNRELRKAVDDLTRGLTAGLWTLLAVMVVIAALGVANAVAALAVEQCDDVRRLRAVGMTVRRVGRMFRLQAVLLALAGAPAGVLCGIALSLALDRVIQGLWSYRVPFQIQWGVLCWSFATSIPAILMVGIATRGSAGQAR